MRSVCIRQKLDEMGEDAMAKLLASQYVFKLDFRQRLALNRLTVDRNKVQACTCKGKWSGGGIVNVAFASSCRKEENQEDSWKN